MKPLTNTRILDLSRLLPGPYATQLLADLGAEVIKVETPRVGDYARMAPPEFGGETMFHMINRGKKSVGLNYRNKRGREIFLSLAETADVIVETFKPGSVDKWGIGYDEVKAVNPEIIYCSISGYGQTGPYRTRPGHDLNYIAIGGMLGLTGEPGGKPSLPGAQIADLGGATFAAMSILAAVLQRTRTGEGQYLDVAMLDPVVHWMMPTAGATMLGGGNPRRGLTPLTGGWPCNGVYETADGEFLTLGCLEPPFWSAFCEATGRNDLLAFAFDEEKIPEVAVLFKSKTRREWLDLIDREIIPLEPVLTLEEMMQDPQVSARGLLKEIDPEGDSPPALRSPFPYPPAQGGAPGLGRDTMEVLGALGMGEDELKALVERRVVR